MNLSIIIPYLLAHRAAAASIERRQDAPPKSPAKGSGKACAPLHILAARASTNAQGEGMTASTNSAINSLVPGPDVEAIVFPASLPPYSPSASKGVQATKDQLRAYVERCPESKIILTGYSQGADVMGSILCGASDHKSNQKIGNLPNATVDLGPAVTPVEPGLGSHIFAAV
jgi:acetylxylan esterase